MSTAEPKNAPRVPEPEVRLRDASRWALPAMALLLVAVACAVVTTGWALRNHALDTRSVSVDAVSVGRIGTGTYVHYTLGDQSRVDPVLGHLAKDDSAPAEVVPGRTPLASAGGERHPAGVGTAVAVASLALGTTLFLWHLRVSARHPGLPPRRGVLSLSKGMFHGGTPPSSGAIPCCTRSRSRSSSSRVRPWTTPGTPRRPLWTTRRAPLNGARR